MELEHNNDPQDYIASIIDDIHGKWASEVPNWTKCSNGEIFILLFIVE